jgi:hypothetical protein
MCVCEEDDMGRYVVLFEVFLYGPFLTRREAVARGEKMFGKRKFRVAFTWPIEEGTCV